MFTPEEKETAKALMGNKDFQNLIAKVFLSEEEKIDGEFIKLKTNEELGEVVRANYLAEEKIKARWSKLRQIGETREFTSHKVPK